MHGKCILIIISLGYYKNTAVCISRLSVKEKDSKM